MNLKAYVQFRDRLFMLVVLYISDALFICWYMYIAAYVRDTTMEQAKIDPD